MIHVSSHAISRYRERVAPVSYEEAHAALSSDVIQRAAAFGVRYVRLGTGQRVVLDCDRVVTVLPKGYWQAAMDRRRTAPFETRPRDVVVIPIVSLIDACDLDKDIPA